MADVGMFERVKPQMSRDGVVATEMALLLPVLALICIITVDYSRIFRVRAMLTDCARAGALCHAMNPSVSAATVEQVALAGAVGLSPTPTVERTTGTDSAGNSIVRVTVIYQFHVLSSFPGIPATTELSRSVVMMAGP